MKKLICIYLLSILSGKLLCQNPVEDAIFLKSYGKINEKKKFEINPEEYFKTEKKNLEKEPNPDTKRELENRISENEDKIYLETDAILKAYNLQSSNENPFLTKAGFSRSDIAGSSNKSSFKGIGDLNVTNFAYGMTDFLIERTKTELNTAFFKRFKEELDKEKYSDLKILFPETVNLLSLIGVEIYQYDHYLNTLRNAFKKDLDAMLDHMPDLLNNHQSDAVFTTYPHLNNLLQLVFETGGWVQDKYHPGEILKFISESEHLLKMKDAPQADWQNLYKIVVFATFISESLSSGEGDNYWVSKEKLNALKDETTLKIYFGLLLELSRNEPYKNITFPSGPGKTISITEMLTKLGEEWNTVPSNITQFRNFIFKIGNETQAAMQALQRLNTLKTDLDSDTALTNGEKRRRLFEASLDVYNSVINLLKLSYAIENLPYIKGSFKINEQTKSIVNMLESGSEIGLHILNGEYSGAVGNLASLMKTVFIYRAENPLLTSLQTQLSTDPSDLANQLQQHLKKLQDELKVAKTKKKSKGKKIEIEGLEQQIKSVKSQIINNIPAVKQLDDALKILENKLKEAGVPDEMKKQINDQIDGLRKQIDGFKKQEDQIFSSTINQPLIATFLKYGIFMANIVEADSPEEAKAAIEAIALPPGSYTIKRESGFNVSLNGYLGVFYGQEVIKGVTNKGLNNFSLTAPVGISLGWGNICRNSKNPWSIGLSIPLIDLGTLASYRFQNESGTDGPTPEAAPNVSLKHIFAPGGFLEIGIGGTPLTFGLGAQIGPRLRDITKVNDADDIPGNSYCRYGATLKVDIPVVTFYSKPGRR